MTGNLARYFGWSYSRTFHALLQQRETASVYKDSPSFRNYTNSQFVSRSKKQITQNNKKRYLKRINSLDPDHDLNMEGKLLNNLHLSLIKTNIYISYQAVLLMTSLLIFHIAFTFH